MTIQEYKEKIIHTIEQMEMEYGMNVERMEIVTELESRGCGSYVKKWGFKMVVK